MVAKNLDEYQIDSEVLDEIQTHIEPPGSPSDQQAASLMGNGHALQRVATQYTTAMAIQKPRQLSVIVANVLTEAKLAGAKFYYAWQVTNRKTNRKSEVKGGSIDLAMCFARNFGNCAVDVDGTETATHFMMKATFIDFETGLNLSRLFRQRKSQNIGSGFDSDRAEDVTFQIAQSKAERNVVLNVMPKWLIDKAVEVARKAEIAQIKPENIVEARAVMLEFFARYGIDTRALKRKPASLLIA
jgi:hypothetical protein